MSITYALDLNCPDPTNEPGEAPCFEVKFIRDKRLVGTREGCQPWYWDEDYALMQGATIIPVNDD